MTTEQIQGFVAMASNELLAEILSSRAKRWTPYRFYAREEQRRRAAVHAARDAALAAIATEVLHLDTLTPALSDGRDFREHHVLSIRQALEAAYAAGQAAR